MILERLKEIISEQLEVDADSVTPETKLGEDLNADSLDIVEMLMALEDEFGVDIPDEEIEKMKTVGDVVNYIQENKN
jgi:acyl carrier protein